MKELLAIGKVNGQETAVLCETEGEEWMFLFNGETNAELETKLRELMQEKHRIGNYPPKTMKLNLYAIFDGCEFFDRDSRSVEVYGDIEQIPGEDGVIY